MARTKLSFNHAPSERRATNRPAAPRFGGTFQSTPPEKESDWRGQVAIDLTRQSFNHRPPKKESDAVGDRYCSRRSVSIHAPSEKRERRPQNVIEEHDRWRVSIPPPPKESQIRTPEMPRFQSSQSAPPPKRRATSRPTLRTLPIGVSIHAPKRRGRRYLRGWLFV